MKYFNLGNVTTPKVDPVEQENKATLYIKYGKRAFDVCLALVILPLIAPIILFVWLVIKLDGGPGFYSQYRVGLNARVFKCWKIRSMVVDAERVLKELCQADKSIAEEWHKFQKLENDPRITKFGRFIRATSLDELPQIWNVLRGDMSFVGPRPFMTSQEHMYRAEGGRAYFFMRPGITGLWQLEGRGATSFVERVGYDTKYWNDISFSRDLILLGRTFKVIVNGTGT